MCEKWKRYRMNGFELIDEGRIICGWCRSEGNDCKQYTHDLERKRDGNGKVKKRHVIKCISCSRFFNVNDYIKRYGKEEFPGRKIHLIRLGTDIVGYRYYLNGKPLSDSVYWKQMMPAYDDRDQNSQDQLAVWELGKKKIKSKDVQSMHAAVTENVDVIVEVAGKYYGKNEILKRDTGEEDKVSSDEDEVFHDAPEVDDNAELKEKLKEIQEEKDKLQRENERLQAVKKENEAKVAEQDGSIKDLQDNIEELKAVIDKQNEVKVKADGEMKGLQDMIKRLKMDMYELKLKDEGNNSKLKILEADKRESDMKIDELQKLLEEGRKSVKELNEQLANAKTRCDNMKLGIDGLKTENKTEDGGGDEAVIKAVVDAIVQNVVCISAMEIEKDKEDMMELNCDKMKDLNEKIRNLKTESKKQKKEFKNQTRNSKSEIMKLKQKLDEQILMKDNTIEYLKKKMEAAKARIKGLEEEIESYKNREKISADIIQLRDAELGKTLKKIMNEIGTLKEMKNLKEMNVKANERKSRDKDVKRKTDEKKKNLPKVVKRDVNSDNSIQNDRKSKRQSYKDAVDSDKDKKSGKSDQKKSSDNVKSENDAKSDNGNQEEWTMVEGKKKGKSDKNVTVKAMKSKNGNYWVSRIIKKKNCTFVQN